MRLYVCLRVILYLQHDRILDIVLHTYICIHMHVSACVCVIYIYVVCRMCIYVYVCVCLFIYLCMYVRIYLFIYVCACGKESMHSRSYKFLLAHHTPSKAMVTAAVRPLPV